MRNQLGKITLSVTVIVLGISVLSTAVNAQNTGLEDYIVENDRNPNVIVLVGDETELDNQIRDELEASIPGKYKRKVKKKGKEEQEVKYKFSGLYGDLAGKVREISESNDQLLQPDGYATAASSSYTKCAYYHDYVFWSGSYLAFCGRNTMKYVPRLSRYWWGNDDISSIYHNHSQVYSTLYEHNYYRGWRYGTGWDVWYVGGSYNNRASSLKVSLPW